MSIEDYRFLSSDKTYLLLTKLYCLPTNKNYVHGIYFLHDNANRESSIDMTFAMLQVLSYAFHMCVCVLKYTYPNTYFLCDYICVYIHTYIAYMYI